MDLIRLSRFKSLKRSIHSQVICLQQHGPFNNIRNSLPKVSSMNNLSSLLENYKITKSPHPTSIDSSRAWTQVEHYLALGRWIDAIKFIKLNPSLQKSKVSFSEMKTIQQLFEKSIRFRDHINFAVDLIRKYPTLLDWRKLVTWLSRHLMPEMAEAILLEYAKKISRDINIEFLRLCNKVMTSYVRNNQPTASFAFFWKVVKEVDMPVSSYHVLSHFLVQNQLKKRQVRQAQDFVTLNFRRVGTLDMVSYHTILEYLYKERQFRRALEWRDALTSRFLLDESMETKEQIVRCLLEQGRKKEALAVTDEMRAQSLMIPPSIIGYFITYHFRLGQVNEARKCFAEHLSACSESYSPSDNCLNALLAGYLRFWPRYRKEISKLQATFLSDKSYPKSSATLAIGYLQNGWLGDAQHLIKKIDDKPQEVWTAIISFYANQGNLASAEHHLLSWLEESKGRKGLSTQPFVSLINAATRHLGDYKLVENYWSQMRKFHIRSDAEVFNALVEAQIESGEVFGAWETIKSFLRMGGTMSLSMICSLMKISAIMKEPELIRSMYHELLRFDRLDPVIILSSAIRAFGFCGDHASAFMLWTRLWRPVYRGIEGSAQKQQTFAASEESVNAILWSLGKCRQKVMIQSVWSELSASEFAVSCSNKEEYVLALLACGAAQEATIFALNEVKEWEYDNMRRMYVRLYLFLEVHSSKYPDLLDTLSEWLPAHMGPNFRGYMNRCKKTLLYPEERTKRLPDMKEYKQAVDQFLTDLKSRNELWISSTECVSRRSRTTTNHLRVIESELEV